MGLMHCIITFIANNVTMVVHAFQIPVTVTGTSGEEAVVRSENTLTSHLGRNTPLRVSVTLSVLVKPWDSARGSVVMLTVALLKNMAPVEESYHTIRANNMEALGEVALHVTLYMLYGAAFGMVTAEGLMVTLNCGTRVKRKYTLMLLLFVQT